MQHSDPTMPQYDGATIVLHWITAFLVVVLWCVGETLGWFQRGTPRMLALSVHITLGVTLGVVLLLRVFWRGSGGRHLPPADPGMMGAVSQLVHTALYLLLIGVVAVGFGLEWLRGDSVFALLNIPGLAPSDRVVVRAFTGLHSLLANTLVMVAGLHALAALAHHYVLRDSVLRRMVPVVSRNDRRPGSQ